MPRGQTPASPSDRAIIGRATRRRKAPAPPVSPRHRPLWLRVLRAVSIGLSVLLAVALVVTGYAGYMSPLRDGGLWGVFPLAFPIVFWTCVLMLVVQLFYCRKGSVAILAGIVATLGPVLTYFPLHVMTPKAPAGSETFTLLTYNMCNMLDQRGADADTTQNAAINYVLGQDADIVCLQEATYFSKRSAGYRTHTQPWQVDSLHSRYPYIHHDGLELMLLSKFPIEPIHLDATKEKFDNAHVAAYRVTLGDGRQIALFSVHLQSLALTQDDRELYRSLTDLQREDLGEVKMQLLHKVTNANVERARQAHFLMRYLRLYGGPDAIICGDFNDVQGCYAIRTLADAGFRSVYPEIGFGPMITYNQNRFLFCIDHVLYRGDLIPLGLRKGRLKASDHYPLTVRFAVPPRDSSPGPLD